MRLDTVVLLHLRVPAHPPAAPQLRRGQEQDDDQDRVRPVEDEGQQRDEADEPERGMQRSGDPPAVERDHRQEVEQVDEETEERKGLQVVRVVGDSRDVQDKGAE